MGEVTETAVVVVTRNGWIYILKLTVAPRPEHSTGMNWFNTNQCIQIAAGRRYGYGPKLSLRDADITTVKRNSEFEVRDKFYKSNPLLIQKWIWTGQIQRKFYIHFAVQVSCCSFIAVWSFHTIGIGQNEAGLLLFWVSLTWKKKIAVLCYYEKTNHLFSAFPFPYPLPCPR